jgi:hypothetical protein
MSVEVWSVLADWTVAVAAGAAAFTAWKGLDAWKVQNTWAVDTDLARKLLVLVFRHKDVLAQVRHFAVFRSEADASVIGDAAPKTEDERRYLEIASAYEKRWEKLAEVRAEIYPLLLEAEAIWGKKARELFYPIWTLETELKVVIQTYLRATNPKESSEVREAASRSLSKKRDIMYDSFGDEDEEDVFKKDYSLAMETIESFMRKKLGR